MGNDFDDHRRWNAKDRADVLPWQELLNLVVSSGVFFKSANTSRSRSAVSLILRKLFIAQRLIILRLASTPLTFQPYQQCNSFSMSKAPWSQPARSVTILRQVFDFSSAS
jgi:hypothetical protein